MHIIIDTTTTQDQFAFAGVGQYTKNITLGKCKYDFLRFFISSYSVANTFSLINSILLAEALITLHI